MSAQPAAGGPLDVVRILAPNPGPFTLEGTNTWIVGRGPSLVIDPGPEDEGHLRTVARAAAPVAAILITHRHPDHAPGAASLARATGAPVLAFDPAPGEEALWNRQQIDAGGIRLVVVHTPGHTPDHVSFHEPGMRVLFTGDAVLGRGTSVIDPPEGDLAAYLGSLRAMLALSPRTLYPGHGPAVWSGMDKLSEYLDHRMERERQVLEALAEGHTRPADLVPSIYRGYPQELYPAAARSILAHLLKLEREGRVRRAGVDDADPRFALADVAGGAGAHEGPAQGHTASGGSARST